VSGAAANLHSIRIARKVERTQLSLTVNGARHEVSVRPYDVLLDVLREQLLLTGTRRGCDMGTCGCCTVILDGRPVLSCLTLALAAEGGSVTTIEGVAALEAGEALHPVQEAFVQTGASQCGFCTPGFIMSAVSLLTRRPDPTEDEIREAISGNLCRCTGYVAIIEAIGRAAKVLREHRRAQPGGAGAPEGAPR
jgi:carbon-monoxide dehydrogenase small subunit